MKKTALILFITFNLLLVAAIGGLLILAETYPLHPGDGVYAVQPVAEEEVAVDKDKLINDFCPLMDEPVVEDLFVTYKGYKIGMCCTDCIPEWFELETEEKDKILNDLIR